MDVSILGLVADEGVGTEVLEFSLGAGPLHVGVGASEDEVGEGFGLTAERTGVRRSVGVGIGPVFAESYKFVDDLIICPGSAANAKPVYPYKGYTTSSN